MFVPGRLFKHNVRFVGKAKKLRLRGENETWVGSLTLLTNIRPAWKGLPGTNTSSLPKIVNYDHKKFHNVDPIMHTLFLTTLSV
jgi:hypothetical protein